MTAYSYSDSTPSPTTPIIPRWREQFRALYIIHCGCGHYFSIECEGVATFWRMGSIGKCREIQVELSCPKCNVNINVLWSYPMDKLPRTPGNDEVIKKLCLAE